MMAMRRRDLLWLFLLALTVRLAVAAFIPRPGYMDTAYYAAGAVRLAQGGGLTEPFLWNYLDDPAGLPHPGFLYWMPLPSLLAAPFTALFSNLQSPISSLHPFPGSFLALQLPFVLLSALLPLLSYTIAWQVAEKRRLAWVAGLLTIFSGFFFPYWTLPETFAPFALFGSLALWLAAQKSRGAGFLASRFLPPASCLLPLASGVLVGLAHLTRADGILLLPVIVLASLIFSPSRNTHYALRITHYVSRIAFVILGYLLPMAPWFLRNLALIGAPLSPAGTLTLWLTNYDDLFCYGCDLSLRSYLAWGWGNILHSKLWALRVNLERFLAEDCLVFLLPFILAGLYRLRRRRPFSLVLIYLFLIYFFHSLAFTFPGPRGGFFHASAPALPFLFAAAVEGLEAAVSWAARRRRWNRRHAQVVFATATVVAALALSGYAAAGKLLAWRGADAAYLETGAWLDAHDVPNSTTVMVGNPPAFWYYTHRLAVAVPNDDLDTLLEAGARYDVAYVLLDENRPRPLAKVYEDEETAGLDLVATFDSGRVRLYRRTE